MVAYDYEAQRWVKGPEAERLLAQQQAEMAPLLRDPAYLRFIHKGPVNGNRRVCDYCEREVSDLFTPCCGEVHNHEDFHEEGCACDDCCDGWEV